MTKGELMKVTMMWRQAHFGAVLSGSLQLPHTSSTEPRLEKEVSHSSPRADPMEVRKFCLNDIRGPVHTTWKVTIPQFSTVSVHTSSSVKGHCMWVHVLMKLMPGPQLPTAVVLMVIYRELCLGSARVPICLCNLSAHTVEIPTKAVVEQVAPANQVPPVDLPTRTSKKSNHKPKRDGSWRPWTSKASKNGPNQSRSRQENCCSNGNTWLHAVTWTWTKLLWSNIK